MLLVQLNESHLAEFKSLLREKYPKPYRSSHLTEAIAFASGFGSNAALVASLKHNKDDLLPVEFCWDRFRSRMAELGEKIEDDVPPQLAIKIGTLFRGWREFRRGDLTGRDEWFHQCDRLGIPFVYLIKYRKYRELHWDCISIDGDRDYNIRRESGRDLVNRLFAAFQRVAKGQEGKPIFEGSSFVGRIERLLPENAETIACEFYRILSGAIGPRRSDARNLL